MRNSQPQTGGDFNCSGHVHINSKLWQIPHVWYFNCKWSPWREAQTALKHYSQAVPGSWPTKAELWGLGFAPLPFLNGFLPPLLVWLLLGMWPPSLERQGCASLHLLQSRLKIPQLDCVIWCTAAQRLGMKTRLSAKINDGSAACQTHLRVLENPETTIWYSVINLISQDLLSLQFNEFASVKA